MIRPPLEVLVDQLMRRVQDLELQISQHFSRREPSVARYLQKRLARTVEDPNVGSGVPTYPVITVGSSGSGAIDSTIPNTFPIVFLEGGFLQTGDEHSVSYIERHNGPQAYVHNITGEYIWLGTEIEVFELSGNSNYPGHWWCEYREGLMIGKTMSAIDKGYSGAVTRYSPVTLAALSGTNSYLCLNLFADVGEDKWVAFMFIDGRFVLVAAEC